MPLRPCQPLVIWVVNPKTQHCRIWPAVLVDGQIYSQPTCCQTPYLIPPHLSPAILGVKLELPYLHCMESDPILKMLLSKDNQQNLVSSLQTCEPPKGRFVGSDAAFIPSYSYLADTASDMPFTHQHGVAPTQYTSLQLFLNWHITYRIQITTHWRQDQTHIHTYSQTMKQTNSNNNKTTSSA